MQRTRIKICGIRDAATGRAAVAAGADAIGLVFVEKSPRHVTADPAREIVRNLPAFVEPVGLFCDASVQHVLTVTRQVGLRVVQLHGSETPEFASQLKGLAIIKGVGFDPARIDAHIDAWRDVPGCAGLLCDAPPTSSAQLTGGSGTTFDWSALSEMSLQGRFDAGPPLILAGGLTPANVGQAIGQVRPYAVDVSSGVEQTRGVKDTQLITAFCDAVRQADIST